MNQEKQDVRWIQRLSNYEKALNSFNEFFEVDKLNKMEQQGLIKAFEYTYELAWNTLKDYLEFQGHANIAGFRDTIREVFKAGLISDGDAWMDMLQSRNRTSHTYNEETANEITKGIESSYVDLLRNLYDKMNELRLDFEKGVK